MKNVLVVDDDYMSREMMETVLKRSGYASSMAVNGEGALSFLQTQTPDMILMDARIGEPDGFETCAQIKSDPATQDIPVIILTSLNSAADIQRAADVGANGFYYKNNGWQGLIEAIRELIG